MMSSNRPFHVLTLTLFLLPPLIVTTYLLSAFPSPPKSIHLYPSLASLPPTSKSWSIYPENFYEGGAYVTFPHGKVRYWLLGPEDGKKIVLIHGLSIPSIIWKEIAPELAARGYRVLLYDLYGRGYSDAPQTIYEAQLFTTQLALLMQHLKWDKASIAGVSMGGAIAASFTANFPHLVDENVILIASAGVVDSNDISKTARFMSIPLIQTLASSVPFRKYLQHLTNSSKSATPEPNPIIEIVRLQSALLPGYNAAVSSSLREGPIRGQAAAFAASGFNGRRVLLIHGTKDTTVPPKYANRIQALLPPSARDRSRILTIEGAGHDLTISHASLVIEALTEFVGPAGVLESTS